MKKTVIIIIVLLLTSSTALAWDFGIEFRNHIGIFTPSDDWFDDLFEHKNVIITGGLSFELELVHGFGPYAQVNWGSLHDRYQQKIDVFINTFDAAMGLQYRYFIREWIAPGFSVGALFHETRLKFEDEYFDKVQADSNWGVDAGHEWNFYPFTWSDHPFPRGIGMVLRAFYQYRPLKDKMGKVESLSGFGGFFGIQYRWEISTDDNSVNNSSEDNKEVEEKAEKKEEAPIVEEEAEKELEKKEEKTEPAKEEKTETKEN